ncbi:MAG: glycosyltransferase family 39 protein [Chloroflexi bacterium]|nr:glycosyltransferase family 39 protein [Chloroflexota bacterium]
MAHPRGRALGGRPLALLVALLLVTFGLRVAALEAQSIWVDEGFSIDFATRTATCMTEMWKARGGSSVVSDSQAPCTSNDPLAIAVDIHPPLYYLLLHEWLPLGGRGEYSVRFPSVMVGILAVLVLFKLGERLAGEAAGLAAAAVGAVAPFYVAYSQEARMYAPVAAFCAFSLYFCVDLLLAPQQALSKRAWPVWLGLVVSGSLATYTHYSAVLPLAAENVLAAGLIVALWRKRAAFPGRLTGAWAGSQALIVLLFVPWLRTTIGQVAAYNVNLWVPNWKLELTQTFTAFEAGQWVPSAEARWLAIAASMILLAGLVALMSKRTRRRGQTVTLSAGLIAVESAMALALFQIRPEFSPRYLMVLATPFYLLLGLGLVALWRVWKPLAPLAAAGLAAVFAVGLWGYEFDPNFQKDDTRTLAQYLESRTTADDVIVLDAPEPLGYYYHGPAQLVYIPGEPATAAQKLTEAAAGKKRVVFIQWFLSTSDPEQLVAYLLHKYGKLTDDHPFRGYFERTYDIPPNTTFALDQPATAATANFGNILQLNAVALSPSLAGDAQLVPDLGKTEAVSGEDLMVALNWRLLKAVTKEYRASAYLTDDQGHLAGQSDVTLRDDQATTTHWPPGVSATDYFVLPTIPGLMPGTYNLNVAVYADGEQERLSVLDSAGAPAGGSFSLGKVSILPPRAPSAPAITGAEHPVAPGVDLVGFTIPKAPVSQGDPLHLTLQWQASAQPPTGLQTTIALMPPAGGPAAWQFSGGPKFPTGQWRPGDQFTDWYDPILPPQLAPGAYQVLVGMGQQLVPIGQVQVLERTRDFTVPAPEHPLTAQLGDAIQLLGYDVDKPSYAAGAAVQVTLYWKALAPMADSYTAFVHILDSGRHVVSQVDAIPAGGQLPTPAWLPGEVVPDHYQLPLKADLPAASYQLEVGFYRADTGVRLKARSSDVQAIDDGLLLGTIAVTR